MFFFIHLDLSVFGNTYLELKCWILMIFLKAKTNYCNFVFTRFIKLNLNLDENGLQCFWSSLTSGQIPLKVRDRADNSKNKDTYEKLLGSKQQGGHVLQIIR
jgi:hypothetical protein